MGRELNPAIYAAGRDDGTTNQRRPLFPNFGTITQIEPPGRSTYHSMQVTLDKRLSNGLSVLANYTLRRVWTTRRRTSRTARRQTNPFDL